MDEICYKPIGVVHSPIRSEDHMPPRPVNSRGVEGTVELLPDMIDGLMDLEGFSHIVLLCHLHLSSSFSLRVKLPSDSERHGVFATRSPRRPNPIAMSVVRLIHIEGATLHIKDIDMVDGTPVLDIKPYIPLKYDEDTVRTGWLAKQYK